MPEYWDGYFFVWEVLRSKFENHFGIIKFFSLKISSFHTLLQYNIRPGYGEVRLYNTRTWKKITSIRVSPFNNFFAYSFESRNLLLLRFRLNRINNNTNTSSALSLGNILFVVVVEGEKLSRYSSRHLSVEYVCILSASAVQLFTI